MDSVENRCSTCLQIRKAQKLERVFADIRTTFVFGENPVATPPVARSLCPWALFVATRMGVTNYDKMAEESYLPRYPCIFPDLYSCYNPSVT